MNELTITLDGASKVPLYEQIYEYIKENIQSGQFACHEKLPSTRALAKHLEVSRSTVELAYEQLRAEGYIDAEMCRGYFVAQMDELYHWRPSVNRISEEKETVSEQYRYDFSPRGIDVQSFPYNIWRKLSREVLNENHTELFRSGDPQGEYGLRESICHYLYQARGVQCDPEQMIVGAGNDYLLMLLALVLGTKHRIAFENPTYRQAYQLFQQFGVATETIELDEKGMRIDQLRESGADIAYVMPSHQYPLGIIMPIQRRMELLHWASEGENRYIIEDDYDSEFRYKGKPIPALQGYDHHEKVIYIGTFSRSIAPAIRISYLVLPKPLLQTYRETCRFLNSTVPRVDQRMIQTFIQDGYFERHLNKMRALYKNRHDCMLTSLKPLWKTCEIRGEHAGVHLLLTFPETVTEASLIKAAGEQGVKVYGLSSYDIQAKEEKQPTILLGYANLSEEQIREGVQKLVEAWKFVETDSKDGENGGF